MKYFYDTAEPGSAKLNILKETQSMKKLKFLALAVAIMTAMLIPTNTAVTRGEPAVKQAGCPAQCAQFCSTKFCRPECC